MTTYTDLFGAITVPPSGYGYQSVLLDSNLTFNWPASGGENLISAIMDVTAASIGISMLLPPADQVSTGQDILIRNIGGNVFTVKDNEGLVVANLNPGASTYLYVTDNTSVAGAWESIAFGVGTSSVDAATLIGFGIKAIGATLNQSHPVLPTSASLTVTSNHRAMVLNFTGGTENCILSSASTLGNDFFTLIRNSGSGTLTIVPNGSDLIDGLAQFTVQPGESLLLFCSGAAWFSVGYGRSVVYNFTQLVKDLSVGGSFTLSSAEAGNKLFNFIGNPSTSATVIVPGVVAVYYVLSNLSTDKSITIKTAAGTGITLAQSQSAVAICDGTNVYAAQSIALVGEGVSTSLTDGSVTQPSLNFVSQTNTGLYKYSTYGMGVAIDGSDIVHFNTTGSFFNGTAPVVSSKAGPTTSQQHIIPAVASDTFTLNSASQTLTNKSITVLNNTIVTAAAPAYGLTATELNSALAQIASLTAGSGGGAVTSVNGRTGAVTLNALDVGALSQATADPLYVNIAGDTMTGNLRLSGAGLTFNDSSTQLSSAYTKAEADTRYVSASGDSMSGSLSMAAGIVMGTATGSNSQSINFNAPSASDAGVIFGTNVSGQWAGLTFSCQSGIATYTMRSTGTAYAPTAWAVSSDVRYKTNIKVIPDALTKLKAIRGCTYDRIDLDNLPSVGVIAQELQGVLPVGVSVIDKDTGMLAVNSMAVIALLVEAVKELSAKLEAK